MLGLLELTSREPSSNEEYEGAPGSPLGWDTRVCALQCPPKVPSRVEPPVAHSMTYSLASSAGLFTSRLSNSCLHLPLALPGTTSWIPICPEILILESVFREIPMTMRNG